jgi:hypothetical protein
VTSSYHTLHDHLKIERGRLRLIGKHNTGTCLCISLQEELMLIASMGSNALDSLDISCLFQTANEIVTPEDTGVNGND